MPGKGNLDLSLSYSLDTCDTGEGPSSGGEEEYDRIGSGIYWRPGDNAGVTAGAWTTLDGRNTGAVDGFSVGAVIQF